MLLHIHVHTRMSLHTRTVLAKLAPWTAIPKRPRPQPCIITSWLSFWPSRATQAVNLTLQDGSFCTNKRITSNLLCVEGLRYERPLRWKSLLYPRALAIGGLIRPHIRLHVVQSHPKPVTIVTVMNRSPWLRADAKIATIVYKLIRCELSSHRDVQLQMRLPNMCLRVSIRLTVIGNNMTHLSSFH